MQRVEVPPMQTEKLRESKAGVRGEEHGQAQVLGERSNDGLDLGQRGDLAARASGPGPHP